MMQLLWIHQILLVRFFLGGKGGGGGEGVILHFRYSEWCSSAY